MSRRGLFGLGGAAALGAAGAAGGLALRGPQDGAPTNGSPSAPAAPPAVPFHGLHQAGIATPAQDHLVLTAYDAAPDAGRAEIAAVLRAWTAAARELTRGRSPAVDPSIGSDAGPARLTVTVGVGGTLLDQLRIPRPAALADLPTFAGDRLEPARGGGGLVVQLCSDDPMVLAHADRVLRAAAGRTLVLRWQDTGFQGVTAHREGRTPRNLMGQLDGTNNVSTSQEARGGPVWVDGGSPGWMAGGSYLVVRRIRMLLDSWEALPVPAQERVIGRHKISGAPLGARQETDAVDLDARGPDGTPRIPANSHVRLSTPGQGEQMRRRGYAYRAGVLSDGTTDQGLLFLCYQKDPHASFVPVQRRLAAHDALNAFTLTTGSALFAVLPGVHDEGDWLGRSLLS